MTQIEKYTSLVFEYFTVHGSRVDKASDRDIRGRQMAPPKTPEPSWDVKKILEKTPWPVKNEAYTVGYISFLAFFIKSAASLKKAPNY